MKRFFTLLILVFTGLIAFAQNTVTGTLVDKDTGDSIIGATVVLDGTSNGTTTDIEGKFTITDVPNGDQQIKISYLGYEDLIQSIAINGDVALGTLNLGSSSVGLTEVEILGSIGTDRRTPVALTNISGAEVALKVGNQEYVEVLRKTPSVYVTKQGGGFGDSRINVRGFDQSNIAVMINGIPVNDMENGSVYWSNWAGLSDVTSKIQIQRGLGATKLAAPTVGGSINIITNAAELERKGTLSLGVGNDSYLKGGLAYSTGLLENGLAASVQVTRKQGNGFVDGTEFSAWSYFLALSKVFNNKHTISLSAVGAPQWHHQRNRSGTFDNLHLQTFIDKGIKYNHTWGDLDGEEFNWRRNFYHKPKVFLNHYWNINNRTDLKTSAYISFGRGGGTGPRGRLRTPGSVFDSYSGPGLGLHGFDGQVRFDDLAAYNQGITANADTTLQSWGEPKEQEGDEFLVTNDGRIYYEDGTRNSNGSGFVRRASMNYHNWYGVLSTLSYNLTDELNLTTGIDVRYYKGEHFRKLENLINADGYLSTSDINNPNNIIRNPVSATFGNLFDSSYKTGNVMAYHNDGLVGWAGAFGQLEYLRNDLSAFVSLSGSSQSFRRIDYFTYYNDENRDSISTSILATDGQAASDEWLTDNPSQISDWVSILGGTVKAGANYNIGNSNVFLNGGYLSRQPIFDDVFLSFSNEINEDRVNQTIYAVEAGYGFKSKYFDAKINVYNTTWLDKRIGRSIQYNPVSQVDGFEFEGNIFNEGDILTDPYGVQVERAGFVNFLVNQRHVGAEFEAFFQPIKELSFDLSLSFGDWKYIDNASGTIYDEDLDYNIDVLLPIENRLIGDAAQTTLAVGVTYKPIKGLRLYSDFMFFDRNYAQFNATEDALDSEAARIPAYGLLDGGVSYSIPFGEYKISLSLNVNNILNNVYISDMFTNFTDDEATADINEFYTRNKGFYGFGTTWNTGLRFHF